MTGLHVGSTGLYAASRCGSPSRVYSLEVESTGLQVGSTGRALWVCRRGGFLGGSALRRPLGVRAPVDSLQVESTGLQVGSTGFDVVIYMLPHDVGHPAGSTV